MAVLGQVIASVPSVGVLAAMTVGKVRPPSMDIEILTFAAETGAASVPATSHVSVLGALPVTLVAAACDVTRKGAVPAAVIVTSANEVPPSEPPSGPPRSRAVSRKLMVRATAGRNSEKQLSGAVCVVAVPV